MGQQYGEDTISEATLSLSIMGNGRDIFCAALVKQGWLFIIINMYLLARNNMEHVIRYNICAAGFVFRPDSILCRGENKEQQKKDPEKKIQF